MHQAKAKALRAKKKQKNPRITVVFIPRFLDQRFRGIIRFSSLAFVFYLNAEQK